LQRSSTYVHIYGAGSYKHFVVLLREHIPHSIMNATYCNAMQYNAIRLPITRWYCTKTAKPNEIFSLSHHSSFLRTEDRYENRTGSPVADTLNKEWHKDSARPSHGTRMMK